MTEETTSNVRGIGGFMFIAGAIACFTPAIALGVPLAIVGGVMWALAPANSKRTQQMVTEAEATGGGCGAGLVAVLFAIVVMAIAAVLAVGAGVAVVGGGL
jgi:hypothetical protein